MNHMIHKRKVNIVSLVANRRLGRTTVAQFWSTCARALIFSPKRNAHCVWAKASKKLISSENDKFFLDNFGTCYANFGRDGLPEELYSVKQICGRNFVEDAAWIEAPLTFDAFPSETKDQQSTTNGSQVDHFGLGNIERRKLCNSIVLLLSNRHLVRLNLHTGELLDDILLPFGARMNWRYVEWNEWQHSFTAKSCFIKQSEPNRGGAAPSAVRNPTATTSASKEEPNFKDTAFMFAWFDCVPFASVFSFSVDHSVFSERSDVCDAGLRSNLLCIGTRKQNVLSIYDFSEVLSNRSVHANDRCKTQAASTLPYYRIEEAPTCLLRVPYCAEYNLELGGFPWSMRYTKSNQEDRVRLFAIGFGKSGGQPPLSTIGGDRNRRLSTRKEPVAIESQGLRLQEVVQDISINCNVSGEPESIVFFEDESGRIAHYAHDRLVLYKLCVNRDESVGDSDADSLGLVEQLTIKREADESTINSNDAASRLRYIEDPPGTKVFYSRSGRVVKLSTREHHDDERDAKPRTLHSVEFDDDLQSILCLFSEYRKVPIQQQRDAVSKRHALQDLVYSASSSASYNEQLVFVAAFYDSLTGSIEREFDMPMPIEVQREPDLYTHSLSLFTETMSLTHVMKHCTTGSNLIRIYRLLEHSSESDVAC